MKKLGVLVTILGIYLLFSVFGSQTSYLQTSDPATPGPHAVTRAEYNFGETAFTPTNFTNPVEMIASVHHPTNLTGGPFPLLVFVHGNHDTCFDPSTNDSTGEWPCQGGRSPIPSYTGYDYAAELLASHGFIVVSISANGVNANGILADDALARAELVQEHLNIWNQFNTTGGTPFGVQFVGKVDLSKVGTMGHSRGGEGVVRHFLLNASQGSPFGVKAVFPLAPTDFSRFVINNVPLGMLLSYCDSDVVTLDGVHYYDDARYNVPGDAGSKHTILVMGGNHNFYNTIWTPSLFPAGSIDDWEIISSLFPPAADDSQCGFNSSNRLTDAQQRGAGKAYLAAFFRAYVKGESQFLPILTGAAPPPPSAATNEIHVSYHPPDSPTKRRDVNRLLNATNLIINTLGGAVTQTALSSFGLCGGEEPQPRFCLQRSFAITAALGGGTPNEPHVTPALLIPEKRGLSQLNLSWLTTAAEYKNDLPAGSRNVSGFQALQFRASINFEDPGGVSQQHEDFTVTLTDGTGSSSSVVVSSVSRALFFPPGDQSSLVVPKVVLNTVRIPLASFTGVNKTDIRSIRFRFDQNSLGALLISDLAFASSP